MFDLPTRLLEHLSQRTPRAFTVGEALAVPERSGNAVWFLHDGLVRHYSLGADGQEHNHGFHGAGEWVHGRLAWKTPPDCCGDAAVGIEVLQPTRATAFDLDELEALRMRDPAVSRYLMARLVAMNAARLGHEAALVQQSAEQRYVDLLRRQPALLDTVKLQDVARWLGITPIALSRIRRRLRERRA